MNQNRTLIITICKVKVMMATKEARLAITANAPSYLQHLRSKLAVSIPHSKIGIR